MKEYLYTTYSMIVFMMLTYKTMEPVKTIYNYNNGNPMYVVNGTFLDSIKVRDFCDTIILLNKTNQPNNIKYYKVFLTDSEIIK